ncbi:MAG: HAD-IC family P-type ATPase, partial [Cyanobium sp.]
MTAERLGQRGGGGRGAGAGRGASLALLLRQFSSPIIQIRLAAALLSFALASPTDGLIILVIVTLSGLLGFQQEHGAAWVVAQLLAVVELRCLVRRDGVERSLPMAAVVPGDLVLLAAGDGIPGDCRLLESRDLCLDEAALTGESFPVEKQEGRLPPDTPLAQRSNVLHLGSHVVSGTGLAVVVHCGRATAYGAIAQRLRLRSPETEFERGVRRFGNLLVEITLVLVALIFAFNTLLARPVVESLLFALALGVGLTPQLLPAIISVNLARGARGMARRHVIVKRLAAIENIGSMDVLCSDKTGTLTTGAVELREALASDGLAAERVCRLARLNALFETGFANPIDQALRELPPPEPAARFSHSAEGEGLPAFPNPSIQEQLGQGLSAGAAAIAESGAAPGALPFARRSAVEPVLPAQPFASGRERRGEGHAAGAIADPSRRSGAGSLSSLWADGSALPAQPEAWSKVDEKPFDFHRKRQSVLLRPHSAAISAITPASSVAGPPGATQATQAAHAAHHG